MAKKTPKRWRPWTKALVWADRQSHLTMCRVWRARVRDLKSFDELVTLALKHGEQQRLLRLISYLPPPGAEFVGASLLGGDVIMNRLRILRDEGAIVARAAARGWDGRLPK